MQGGTLGIIGAAFGGIGVFLLGMRFLSDGLQALAGSRLNRWISSVADNRLLALLSGVCVTCVVQSSTATTVMVVGLVDAGAMSLAQAVAVVFGANVGTTLSLWLLALDVSKCGGIIVGVAVFVHLFARRERLRNASMAAIGLGMIFFGLETMNAGFAPLRSMPQVREALGFFEATSTLGFLGAALAGAVATAVVHSSAAVVLLAMGLAGAGAVEFPTAVAIVLGSNVGTTATALVSCIGASRNALRAALAHTLFNVAGVLAATLVWRSFSALCMALADAARPERGPSYWPFAIACVHSCFNVATTALLFPLMPLFVAAVRRIVPEHESEKEVQGWKPLHLDERLLHQPAVALGQAQLEVLRMADTCAGMLRDLHTILSSPERDEDVEESVFRREDALDIAQKEISQYVGRVLETGVSGFQSGLARRLIRQADEYESVSDCIRNALKAYLKIRNAGEDLSNEARAEISALCDSVSSLAATVSDIVQIGDAFNVAAIESRSEEIENEAKRCRDAHLARIGATCRSPVKSLVYSDLVNAFRRQNDHLANIAETLLA
ncbi:MAG: Na/Pi cotransporter family protein [Kiritimatiellae bacterium]|nr:Na/Pi cotransporter family protein [Kiritimatiellia bacterium]